MAVTADLRMDKGEQGVGWFELGLAGDRVVATVVSSDRMRVVARLGSTPKDALVSAIRGLFANVVTGNVPDAEELARDLLRSLPAERSHDVSSSDLFAPPAVST